MIREAMGGDHPNVPLSIRAPPPETGHWAGWFSAGGLFALLVLVGCNDGDVVIGKLPWTCLQDTSDRPPPEHQDLVALWRLDEDEGVVAWKNEVTGGPPLTPGGNPGPRSSNVRVGGRGRARFFNGTNYARATWEGQSSTPAGLTVSTWVSLRQKWFADVVDLPGFWPIISVTEAGSSYRLGIRWPSEKGGGPELVFSSRAAGQVSMTEVTGVLPSDPEAWGVGNWYHVAGTYQELADPKGRAKLGLYWDAIEIQDLQLETTTSTGAAVVGSDFYVATDAEVDANAALTRFTGYVDDVAVFKSALDQAGIYAWVNATKSVPGPSGYRWSTWDAHRSVASWCTSETNNGLQVRVDDGDWSGGGAYALLTVSPTYAEKERKDVWSLGQVRLRVATASAQENKEFDFALTANHGRQQCVWHVMGKEETIYLLDRAPKSCRCDDCGCTFPVESASLGSPWTDTRTMDFAIGALEFLPADKPDLGSIRGAMGLNDWCWRPISFNHDATARFTEQPGISSPVRASLVGPNKTTAMIAADFGVGGGLDLSGYGCVKAKAVFHASYPPQFVLISSNDATYEPAAESAGQDTYLWRLGYGSEPDRNAPLDEDGNRVPFDPKHVKYLGIQKAWDKQDEALVELHSVELLGSDSPDCRGLPE